ncbi:arginine/ornithine succinyltransferase subunit alpha, partial [Paraburkholderia sp. RL18-103-BIB-C]
VVCVLPLHMGAGGSLARAARAALGVEEGDAVRCVPLHAPHQDEQSGDAQ